MSETRKKTYSEQVRKKLATSSRTGQACDRCKLRKIRCDADPNGCAGCRAACEVCETTDRITRKAQRRGHTDILENENTYLRRKLAEYKQKLADLGVDVPDVSYNEAQDVHAADGERKARSPVTATEPSMWQKHRSNLAGNLSPNPALSMLRGSMLSLFGMHIDLSEFAEDPSDQNSPQTYAGFIYHMRATNLSPPPLPPTLAQAKESLNWFFKFLNPYTPLLDKRQTYALLVDIYNDPRPGPRPGRTAAQEAIIHLMFGYLKWQFGSRNQTQTMMDESMAHFKYAISLVKYLFRDRTLQDVQALSLIVIQLRGFSRPGASWLFGQMTVNLAVECGLNRSAESLTESERRDMDTFTIELRKRVFWALHGLVVDVSIRLGRPLPLRLSDIDIEFPSPVHDYLEYEVESLSEFQKCSFHVGIAISKMLALFSDLLSAFYTLEKPSASAYAHTLPRLKSDLESWRHDLPKELSNSSSVEFEIGMYAMYLEFYEAEFQFLLYHPLLHPADQPESYQKTVTVCQEAISEALQLLLKFREAKSMDVPWHITKLMLAMIFTHLFIEDQRGSELEESDIIYLESNLMTWFDLFGTVGAMLGSGNRLQNAVGQMMQNVLDKMRARLNARAVNAAQKANVPSLPSPDNPSNAHGMGGMSTVLAVKAEAQVYAPRSIPIIDNSRQAYTASPNESAYGPAYDRADAQTTTYGTAQLSPEAADYTTKQASTARASGSADVTYSNQAGTMYHAANTAGTAPQNEWMRWGQANLNTFISVVQQDYLATNTANTLMNLGIDNSGVHNQQPLNDENNQWPLNIYHLPGQYGANSGPPG